MQCGPDSLAVVHVLPFDGDGVQWSLGSECVTATSPDTRLRFVCFRAQAGIICVANARVRSQRTLIRSSPGGNHEEQARVSRRDALKLMMNMGVVTMAGGSMLASRSLFAQQATAVLGHFGRPIRRRSRKASGAFQKAYGDKVKTEYVTVGGGPQVIAAIAGNSMDICNIGSRRWSSASRRA
jgi:hypothetical protein